MNARILVPTEEDNGLDSNLAEHFGRAPYFTVIDLDEKNEVSSVKTVPNTGEHAGGSGYAHDLVLELKPKAIIVYGMGPRGLIGFQNAKVAVLKANANTVREVVSSYKEDELEELTEGCHEAHHQ
jgi:predicted Fe-Mo cluster-binding NifX family protein